MHEHQLINIVGKVVTEIKGCKIGSTSITFILACGDEFKVKEENDSISPDNYCKVMKYSNNIRRLVGETIIDAWFEDSSIAIDENSDISVMHRTYYVATEGSKYFIKWRLQSDYGYVDVVDKYIINNKSKYSCVMKAEDTSVVYYFKNNEEYSSYISLIVNKIISPSLNNIFNNTANKEFISDSGDLSTTSIKFMDIFIGEHTCAIGNSTLSSLGVLSGYNMNMLKNYMSYLESSLVLVKNSNKDALSVVNVRFKQIESICGYDREIVVIPNNVTFSVLSVHLALFRDNIGLENVMFNDLNEIYELERAIRKSLKNFIEYKIHDIKVIYKSIGQVYDALESTELIAFDVGGHTYTYHTSLLILLSRSVNFVSLSFKGSKLGSPKRSQDIVDYLDSTPVDSIISEVIALSVGIYLYREM